MSGAIWKYEVELSAAWQLVKMPRGARLLSVAGQHVEERGAGFARAGTFPMLWALVDPDAPKANRLIAIVGTGHPTPHEKSEYVGSAICGAFVWHVFDGGES